MEDEEILNLPSCTEQDPCAPGAIETRFHPMDRTVVSLGDGMPVAYCINCGNKQFLDSIEDVDLVSDDFSDILQFDDLSSLDDYDDLKGML